MAIRPIYISSTVEKLVKTKNIEFEWFPGFSKSQKQKSFLNLHSNATKELKISSILEISSASNIELGRKLSAFNLLITTPKYNNKFTVETAFQGSKVFEKQGPFRDLYGLDSRAAKRDPRLKSSGKLIHFEFYGRKFPLKPQTYFYDWLYINALYQNVDLSKEIMAFRAFTDIEFNPQRSINCQAHSAALYVSLKKHHLLEKALSSHEKFLQVLSYFYNDSAHINSTSQLPLI